MMMSQTLNEGSTVWHKVYIIFCYFSLKLFLSKIMDCEFLRKLRFNKGLVQTVSAESLVVADKGKGFFIANQAP